MKHDVREFIKKAELLGFTLRPGSNGGGHIVLDHPNGTYTSASTPGDYRGMRNALADLERVAGQKLPRPNHRKSRKNFASKKPAEMTKAQRKHREQFEQQRAADQAREKDIEATIAAERRRREIEELMR